MSIQLDAPRYPRCPQTSIVLLCEPLRYELGTRVLTYSYAATCTDCGYPHAGAKRGSTSDSVYDIAAELGLRVVWGDRPLEDVCRHDTIGVEVSVAKNGIEYYRRACANPECREGRRLKKDTAKALLASGTLRITGEDRRIDVPPCERCGSREGCELHHYAPWSLFDDAEAWATGYLCRPCHEEWHRRTRTGSFAASAA